jgi:DNA-directed RNA polymerase
MCVLLNFLFAKKEKKLWQTLLPLKVSQQFANIQQQHTQVEIQLVIITLQFL